MDKDRNEDEKKNGAYAFIFPVFPEALKKTEEIIPGGHHLICWLATHLLR